MIITKRSGLLGWIAGCRKEILAAYIILFISCIVSASAFARHDVYKVTCTPSRPAADQDQISTKLCKRNLAVVDVQLKRGINGAHLSFSKNYKPRSLEIRLKGFSNLESFSITSQKVNYSSSLKAAPLTREVRKDVPNAMEKESRLHINIKGTSEPKMISVVIPCAEILADSNECDIFWIDAYR